MNKSEKLLLKNLKSAHGLLVEWDELSHQSPVEVRQNRQLILGIFKKAEKHTNIAVKHYIDVLSYEIEKVTGMTRITKGDLAFVGMENNRFYEDIHDILMAKLREPMGKSIEWLMDNMIETTVIRLLDNAEERRPNWFR